MNKANYAILSKLVIIFTIIFCSCNKTDPSMCQLQDNNIGQEMDRLCFNSIEEFEYAMSLLRSGRTKSEAIIRPRISLIDKLNEININEDPILRYDLRNYTKTKSTEDISIYQAAGYDELIPDENLAYLLNARAEIEIEDIIYKISPQGTYYFDKSFEQDFYSHYAEFEESKGVPIDTLTVLLKDGIYRHLTFGEDDHVSYYASDYCEEDEFYEEFEVLTKAPTITSSLQFLNYNDYPRYCSDAKTVVGKIFQSLCGRNKSFDYNFTNKRKFSSKFFYYDYIFWSSIGINTKMQKKSGLLWSQTPADEIYVGWGDIITKTELKGNILEYPTKAKATLIKNVEYNESLNKNDDVVYILGLYFSQADVDKAVGLGLKSLLSTIKKKMGQDVSYADKICVIGPKSYYTIFPSGGDRDVNTKKFEVVFYKDFSLGMTIDALNLPSDWKSWAASILKTTYELPNTKLYKGEVRTAVNYDGKIGALSIYK